MSALLAIGCEGVLGIQDWTPKPTASAGCTLNTDCATDLVCVFAHCSIACRDDRDCQAGERCLTLNEDTSGCVSPAQASCTTASCSSGTECADGQCRTPCSAGCRTDQRCEGSVCVGVNEPGEVGTGGAGGSSGRPGSGGKSGASASGGKSGSGSAARGGTNGAGTAGQAGEQTGGGTAGNGAEGGEGGAGTGGLGGSSGGGAGGSVSDPCVGVVCEDPPATKCQGSEMQRSYEAVGSCTGGDCSYSYTDTPCPFGCAGGACKADPCTGVTCNDSPANTCQDGGHLTAYDTTGNCNDGDCSYSSTSIPCTCVGNACTTDPCTSIVCDSPPAPTCPGQNTRRTFSQTGTCSGGSCDYAHSDTPCDFGCAGGACNPDPCSGVTCNSPPAAACPGGLTLRTFDAQGTCSAGICSYGHVDTPCAQACATSPTAHCQCNAGYSGNGVTCNDDNECTLNTDDCDNSPVAGCSNTAGSYNCSCPAPYQGSGHGTNGCTCPAEPLCDSAGEQSGSYCSNATTRVTCSDNNGCQQAASGTCTNLALEKCVGTHPGAVCEQTAGFPTDGGGSSQLSPGTLFAVPFTLTQPLTLTRLALISNSASQGVRMAVYTDSSGLATYKAFASAGSLVVGRNELVISDPPSSSPVTLTAGAYWIAISVQATTQLATTATGGVRYNTSWTPWDKAFPAGAITSSPDTLSRANLYVVGKP